MHFSTRQDGFHHSIASATDITFGESPMGRYDITLRHLTRIGCRAFLQAIGGEGRLTVLETDFPTARERRIDHLAVIDAPDGSRTLLHVEFQATVDARMPKRMLGYYSEKPYSVETILRQRFPGQVPFGLADRLSHVAAETLDEILRKSLTAASVAEVLGPDQPANGSRPKA